MDLITKTILLADDEEEIRTDLALFLEFSDYKVIQVKDGKEAYQSYLDNTFDLIITDIEMPRTNGLELVEKIRAEDKEIPILIISGYSDKDKLLRAIKLNLVEYMIKPFTREKMLKTITKIFIDQEDEENHIKDKVVSIKGYSFDFTSLIVSFNEKEYTLTKHQSKLLKLFSEQANTIFSPVDIYYHLYPDYSQEYSNASVRNIIKRLRAIFPKDVIESIYSEGYRFNPNNL